MISVFETVRDVALTVVRTVGQFGEPVVESVQEQQNICSCHYYNYYSILTLELCNTTEFIKVSISILLYVTLRIHQRQILMGMTNSTVQTASY